MANTFSVFLTLATFLTGIFWVIFRIKHKKAEKENTGFFEQKQKESEGFFQSLGSLFPVFAVVFVLRSFLYEPFQIPSGSMIPTLQIGDFILVEKFSYGIHDPIWNKKLISTGDPKRGDVAVFQYPEDKRVAYIKRVIGLPGDKVMYNLQEKSIKIQTKENKLITLDLTEFKESDWNLLIDFQTRSNQFYRSSQLENKTITNEQRVINFMTKEENYGNHRYFVLAMKGEDQSGKEYFRQENQKIGVWLVPEGHYFMMGDDRDNSADSRYWGFVPEENLIGKAKIIWMSFQKQENEWPTGFRFKDIGKID